ncbi:MAG: hypothetical protein IJ190_06630 [Prevotella sp.]|nr:hypothetical protein [Prevotella sp.]
MKKRLQNKVAESRIAMPVVAVYATCCWLLAGLIQENWWVQFGYFALSTYLMMVMNNSYALIRVYSRMLSCSFMALTCMACFLFPSFHGAATQLLVIATYLILFHTYQDKSSVGMTYYGFLFLGLASMAYIPIIYLLPVLWILMWSNLQALSWRTFLASLLGVITPYWFWFCWLFYQEDLTPFADHFIPLADFQTPFHFSVLSLGGAATLLLLVVFTILGAIHFWHTSFMDKIRIRQFYSLFIRMNLVIFLLICLQPQHYDSLIRLAIVNTAPLTAHYISLTHTRFSNVVFIIMTIIVLILTTYNLWTQSSLF